jgi:biotin carboxyl carrier protein
MTVRRYRILIRGKTYDVEVGDTSSSPVQVVVNGVTYQIELPGRPQHAVRPARPPAILPQRTPATVPVTQPVVPAPSVPTGGGAHAVTAQMPGKVVSVAAKSGDQLTRGQPICIIESMKMELTIAAPRDCKVTAIRIAPGEAVRNGQVLAEIE